MSHRIAALLVFLVAASLPLAGVHVAAATAPAITGLTPTSGGVGVSVTISGSNLNGATAVLFNGRGAGITWVAPDGTRVVATVPGFASTGPVTVTTPGGTTASPAAFTVTPGLAASPTVVPAGQTTFLYGTAFGANESVSAYLGSTYLGTIATDGSGNWQMLATIPAGLASGAYTLIATGSRSSISSSTGLTLRSDWLQPGYSARHRGFSPFETTINSGTAPQLDGDWNVSTGFQYAASAAPVEVGGTVIVADTYQQFVRAFNAASGGVAWAIPTPMLDTGVAASNGILFYGTSNGYVTAIRATNGTQVWGVCVACSSPVLAMSVTPTIANGLVYAWDSSGTVHVLAVSDGHAVGTYVGAGTSPVGPVAVLGTNLFFSDTAGSTTWREVYGPFGMYRQSGSATLYGGPSVDRGTGFWAGSDGNVYSMGSYTWTTLVDASAPSLFGPPTVADNRVFVTSNLKVWALDETAGTGMWSATLTTGASGPPTVANGVVYVPEGPAVEMFDTSGVRLGSTSGGRAYGYALMVVNGQVFNAGGWEMDAIDLSGGGL